MDKKALTEQRRETVIGLLKNMNIKKNGDGGFDKDDVYESMQQLCDLYEKNIEELENAYETEIGELRERYQKYDDNNELYVSLIMEAKKSSNEIINQAKTEVETILAEGQEQVAKQEKDLEQMRSGMEVEKEAITKELNASREAVEAEKKAMWAEVEAEREKTMALKNKYSQHITAMEDEFAEIKTNILRTAGRIDSLKSKLVDDDDIEWDVEREMGVEDIEFPTPDEGVEYDAATVFNTGSAVSGGFSGVAEAVAAEPIEPIETAETSEAPLEKAAVGVEDVTAPAAAPVEEQQEAGQGAENEFTLEDLTEAPAEKTDTAAKQDDKIDDIDDIDIKWPDLNETPTETEEPDEISFEGLEELFKDE